MYRFIIAAFLASMPLSASAEQEFELWVEQLHWNGQNETWAVLDYDGKHENLRFGVEYTQGWYADRSDAWLSGDFTWLYRGVIGPTVRVTVGNGKPSVAGGIALEHNIGATLLEAFVTTNISNSDDFVNLHLRSKTKVNERIDIFSNTNVTKYSGIGTNWVATAGVRFGLSDVIFAKAGMTYGESWGEEVNGVTLSLGTNF